MEFKAAKCPSCGGELQVPPDKEVVKCMYCGNDVIVKKAIAAKSEVSVTPLISLMKTAHTGKNPKEAHAYANKILELDSNNTEAWFIKGMSLLGESSYADPKIDEALNCFQNIKKISQKVFEEYWSDIETEIVFTNIFLSGKALNLEKQEIAETYLYRAFRTDSKMQGFQLYLTHFFVGLRGSVNNLKDEDKNYFSNKDVKKIFDEAIKRIPNFKIIISGRYRSDLPEQIKEYPWLLEVMYDSSGAEKIRIENNCEKFGVPYEVIPPPTDKVKKCFVATATYGTAFEPEVEFLRYWRDKYLVKSFFGNLFVEAYYKVSPPIADWISKSEKRKTLVRFFLDKFIKLLRRKI